MDLRIHLPCSPAVYYGYYDRVDLCLCEFLLDAVCDMAFKSPKPTSDE